MTGSVKKSDFLAFGNTPIPDSATFDFVSSGTNFKITFANFQANLGVTGTIVQTGDVADTPVLSISGTVNGIRNLNAGPGVSIGVDANDSIEIEHNFTVDNTGAAILGNPTADSPTMRSIVGTGGVTANVVNETVVINGGGLSNRVIVTQASDLAGSLDSTKEYFIDGVINMGSQSIEVPAGGLNITGYNFDVSQLTSNVSSYTMFTSPAGGSGNFLGKDLAFEVTGANAQVFDLVSDTGNEAVECMRVNWNNCTSLGELDNYRQGLETGTGRFGGTPNLTLTGAWAGGYFITTSIVRSLSSSMTGALYEAGTAFVMQSRFRSNQNIDLPANAAFFDFAAANFPNPSTLQVEASIITRDGVSDGSDSNLTPNITASALACQWTGCQGLPNTFVGGQSSVSAETATTITSSGVFVDVAGTFTTVDLTHFDSPSSGQLRHLGNAPIDFVVVGQFVLDSAANDEVDLKVVIFRDATTSFEDGITQRRVINNLQGGRNVAYFAVFDSIVLNKNDYVKFQVANVSATTDITAELDSTIRVGVR